MSRCCYQPLTVEGVALKEAWKQCVDWDIRLQEIHEELNELDRSMDADELRREKHVLEDKLRTLRESVRYQISNTPTLSSMERRVLRLRYLYADPWESIAIQIKREPSAAFMAHRKALNKVAAYFRFATSVAV